MDDKFDDPDRDPVEVLTEEFLERHRQGQYPSISEYTRRFPHLAEQIKELIPAAVALEELKHRRHSRTARGAFPPDRLGDYRIIREIGRGGMGIVYEAEQQSLGRHVALKVLPEQWLGDAKQVERFRRESQTAARLHHSNIVPVFGVGSQDRLHYYVMQYIASRSLDEILSHLRSLAGQQPLASDDSEGATATSVTRISTAAAAHALLDGTLKARVTSSEPAPAGDAADEQPSQAGPDTPAFARDPAPDLQGPFGSQAAPAPRDAWADTECGAETTRSLPPEDTPTKTTSEPAPPRQLHRDQPYWNSVARLGLQVAEALDYAHAQGVYHRDIKPGNLLLDAQGTVWITDFGLAKAVAQDNLSRSGDIIGTLRYMAPEQFDGQTDQRSDIYSLGLTLYELLTLQPAFREEERSRLIQQVLDGEITPPRRISTDIPRDLETVVLKAISRDPNHRYRTAGALADDLRRYLEDRPIAARRIGLVERTWRWSRRNPTVSSLSLTVLILIAVSFATITWQWRKAKMESVRAEGNLSLALDSMDEMLTQFSSSWMARPAEGEAEEEQMELLPFAVSDRAAVIMQRALSFYDRFAQQNSTNPRLRQDAAKANRRIGDIQQRLGRVVEARAAYQNAIAGYEALADDYPENDQWAREAAATYRELGTVLLLADEAEAAQGAYVTSIERLQQLSKQFPTSRETTHQLAVSHSTLGTMMWRHVRWEDRQAHILTALTILDELSEKEPSHPEYRFMQASCYRSLAYHAEPSTEPHPREQAVKILDNLVADYPSVPDYQCELSEILATSWDFARRRREELSAEVLGELETSARRAVELAEDLTDRFPSIPRYSTAHSRAAGALANVLQRQQRLDEAERYFRQTVRVLASLNDDFPQHYQVHLGSTRQSLAENLGLQGKTDEAIETSEQAIAELQSILKESPEHRFAQMMLVRSYRQLAQFYRDYGDPAEAERAERAADKLQRRPPRGRRPPARNNRPRAEA